jgi:hypothetical protein
VDAEQPIRHLAVRHMDVVPTRLALEVLLQALLAVPALVYEAMEHERNCGRSVRLQPILWRYRY